MNLINRIFVRTILMIAFATLGGYGVFTTGNAPNVLNNSPEVFYLVLGTYILSIILIWFGQTLNEIEFANSKDGEQ